MKSLLGSWGRRGQAAESVDDEQSEEVTQRRASVKQLFKEGLISQEELQQVLDADNQVRKRSASETVGNDVEIDLVVKNLDTGVSESALKINKKIERQKSGNEIKVEEGMNAKNLDTGTRENANIINKQVARELAKASRDVSASDLSPSQESQCGTPFSMAALHSDLLDEQDTGSPCVASPGTLDPELEALGAGLMEMLDAVNTVSEDDRSKEARQLHEDGIISAEELAEVVHADHHCKQEELAVEEQRIKDELTERDAKVLAEFRDQQRQQTRRIEEAEQLCVEGIISDAELAGIKESISTAVLEHVKHEDEEVLARLAFTDRGLLDELRETPFDSDI
jgi:hypothetical protein